MIDQKSLDVLRELGFQNIKNIPKLISFELEDTSKRYQLTLSNKTKGKVIFIGHAIPTKGIFELVEASV